MALSPIRWTQLCVFDAAHSSERTLATDHNSEYHNARNIIEWRFPGASDSLYKLGCDDTGFKERRYVRRMADDPRCSSSYGGCINRTLAVLACYLGKVVQLFLLNGRI